LVGLVPACIALAWLPLRDYLPNTDLALVLVVAVAGVGFVSDRLAVVVGSIGAGISFDLLHTRPYGHLTITNGRDELTTAFLVLAGIAMGELASRLARYRRVAASESDAFALVTDAAELTATGSEARLVIEALGEELVRGLGLRECRFEHGSPSGEVPCLARDGGVTRLSPAEAGSAPDELDLPIWAAGNIVGYYRLAIDNPDGLPSKAQGRLAVNIADQAGAALAATGADPTEPSRRRRNLRLVRG
jgi:hypothetical protein